MTMIYPLDPLETALEIAFAIALETVLVSSLHVFETVLVLVLVLLVVVVVVVVVAAVVVVVAVVVCAGVTGRLQR